MAKDMLLKDILPHVNFFEDVILFERDSEVWKGSVLDIPWVYADFLLDTDADGEAICIHEDEEDKKIYLGFYIKENPAN